jgi:hypothetical protein
MLPSTLQLQPELPQSLTPAFRDPQQQAQRLRWALRLNRLFSGCLQRTTYRTFLCTEP